MQRTVWSSDAELLHCHGLELTYVLPTNIVWLNSLWID
jgi:hypothetical protein